MSSAASKTFEESSERRYSRETFDFEGDIDLTILIPSSFLLFGRFNFRSFFDELFGGFRRLVRVEWDLTCLKDVFKDLLGVRGVRI